MSHPVVSREQWLLARRELLRREKELTRQRDALCAARRELPWVRLETQYTFASPQGPVTLAQLFGERSQLFIYHFMLPPGGAICSGCALLSDHVDSSRQHFEQADLSFAAVSRAGIDQIEQARRRMGWSFRWVSSEKSSFNYDFGVSFSEDGIAQGTELYNYDKPPSGAGEAPGCSIFVKEGQSIYHTYSAYTRGLESLIGAFAFLDLVPKGRNEPDSIMQWVRLHDEYGQAPPPTCCH